MTIPDDVLENKKLMREVCEVILTFDNDAVRSESILAIALTPYEPAFCVMLHSGKQLNYTFSDCDISKRACAAAIQSWKKAEGETR